uniref:Secreted protein n=1 Tax=Caenorhabditis tropicalis TaxID=1561998 RepID=A0A1I7UWC6_9PELO
MIRNVLLILLLAAANASPHSFRFLQQFDDCENKKSPSCDAFISAAQEIIERGQDISMLCPIFNTCPLHCYEANNIVEACETHTSTTASPGVNEQQVTVVPTVLTSITDVPVTLATGPEIVPKTTTLPITSTPPGSELSFTSTVFSLGCKQRITAAGESTFSVEYLNGILFLTKYNQYQGEVCRLLNNHFMIDDALKLMKQYCSETEANDISLKLEEARNSNHCPPY